MKLFYLLMSSLVAAAPAGRSPLHSRQVATLCEQYGYWSANGYEVNNNNWGKASATSGSQCTTVDSASSSGVAWHTTWTWEGNPGSVKSYAYSGRWVAKGHTIASIRSMSTSVSWDYDTSNIRANVAYDIFTAKDPNHVNSSGDYELMIW
jgi:xyloglucan-specific endo-beta-1,4-glucanase